MYWLSDVHHQGKALRMSTFTSVLVFSLCFVFVDEDVISQPLLLTLSVQTFTSGMKSPQQTLPSRSCFGSQCFLTANGELTNAGMIKKGKNDLLPCGDTSRTPSSLLPPRPHIPLWTSSSWPEELCVTRSASWLCSKHLSSLFCTLTRTTATEEGRKEGDGEREGKRGKKEAANRTAKYLETSHARICLWIPSASHF